MIRTKQGYEGNDAFTKAGTREKEHDITLKTIKDVGLGGNLAELKYQTDR